jgi:TonB family protein
MLRGSLLLALALAATSALAHDTTTTPAATPAASARGTGPKAISTPAPEFPRGVQNPRRARVVLQMKVLADGGIEGLQVVQSGGEAAYDEAALAAAKQWKFSAATNADGQPVDAVIRVPLAFVPPATPADVAAGVQDILKQPCSRLTAEVAAWRQQQPDGKLEDMPTFKASTGMVMVMAFGRPANEMVQLIKYWNATLPGIYASVADECAARPDAVYEDVWAGALKRAPAPPR